MPELPANLAEPLRQGVQQLGLDPTDQQYTLWLRYLELLAKWNQAYNLTAIRDPRQMVTRHLLDSLAIADHVGGRRIIDVGSGAGLPGVPLAVLFPQRQIHLLDSNGKKTRFLFQVKTALGLDNMTIHHQRVESYRPDERFDVVLSRAFASLQDMAAGCSHLLQPQGFLLAMKGARPEAELIASEAFCEVIKVTEIAVPGLAEKRHLVKLALRPVSEATAR